MYFLHNMSKKLFDVIKKSIVLRAHLQCRKVAGYIDTAHRKPICICQLSTELECRTSVRDISNSRNVTYCLPFIYILLIYCISQCVCLFSSFTLTYYCLFFHSFLFLLCLPPFLPDSWFIIIIYGLSSCPLPSFVELSWYSRTHGIIS